MIVEILGFNGYELSGEVYEEYYKVGSQHRVIEFFPDTVEVELVAPDGTDTNGDGVTFFPGEYKIIVDD